VFVTHHWSGEAVNAEPDKHRAVAWIHEDSIPADFVTTTATALNNYLTAGAAISTEGW
jgi:hypothetical protein